MRLKVPERSENDIFWNNSGNNSEYGEVPDPVDLQSRIKQEQTAHVSRYLERLGLEKGAKILDLGCGNGNNSVNFFKKGFVVTGIDKSEEVIHFAQKNYSASGPDGSAVFHRGDAEQLDLPDNFFDVVIAMNLVEYLLWDRWVLQEILRVLKPGGHLIVTVPNNIGLSNITNPSHISSNLDEIKGFGKKISKAFFRLNQKNENYGYRNFYIPSRFRRMLTGIDFEITDSLSHGFGPFIILNRSNRMSVKIDRILNSLTERKIVPLLSELGNDYIFLCRKREKSPDFTGRGIFLHFSQRMKAFKSGYKDLFFRRKTWLDLNPEFSHFDLQQFRTADYSGKNVLVISPHPDDEIIGCGGTLIKLLEAGSRVTVLQLTDGSGTCALENFPEHAKKTVRLGEAQAVADNLGIHELISFGIAQSGFGCSEDTVKNLTELLNRIQPAIIFIPFINDSHPDHIVANELLCRSLVSSTLDRPKTCIYSYEVWSLVPPNVICTINEQFDKKTELLMKYRTAMKVVDYVHFCEDLNAYHADNLLGKRGFAEVFLAVDAEKYKELIQHSKRTDTIEEISGNNQ